MVLRLLGLCYLGFGLVPRVIREGLGFIAAISCYLEELGASFILSYHEIILDGYLYGSTDKALTSS